MKQPLLLLDVAAQSQYFVKCVREIVITLFGPTSKRDAPDTNLFSHPLDRS